MKTTYAVVWREGDKPLASGRLEVRPTSIALAGASNGRPVEREVPLDALLSIRVGRSQADRLEGQPSLLLEPESGPAIRIAGVAQPGIVGELAQRLAGLRLDRGGRSQHALVVVPLKNGSRERAGELVAAGPPLDLQAARLSRHQVFLLEHEAVFLFEMDSHGLDELLRSPGLWRAAAEWQDIVAGPPQIAEDVFSWKRQSLATSNGNAAPDLSFEPTPGAGDSDGGDVFSPS